MGRDQKGRVFKDNHLFTQLMVKVNICFLSMQIDKMIK